MKPSDLLVEFSKYISEADKLNPCDFTESLEKEIEKSYQVFYHPHEKIPSTLQKFKDNLKIAKPKKSEYKVRGELLEEIIYLAFRGLRGLDSFKSFQSAGAQYDLLVTGDNPIWLQCCQSFYLEKNHRKILIEGKAKQSRVSDQDFARLCSIIETTMPSVGIGIFFSLEGAAGYPKRNAQQRKRSVRDCLLRAMLLNARHQKCVIVFDKEDIFMLDQAGSLMTLIRRKVKELEELSGLSAIPVTQPREIDLPPHLSKYV